MGLVRLIRDVRTRLSFILEVASHVDCAAAT